MYSLTFLLPGLLLLFHPTLQQQDFLSLSCGASRGFTDNSTGIVWETDSEFISNNAGQPASTRQGKSVRFFPLSNLSRNLNCFDIPRKPGLHLARATFDYGNYDGLSLPPSFQLVINQTVVVNTIDLSSQDPWSEEFVFSGGGKTSFCVLATRGSGIPVISSLEVRPLAQGSYQSSGVENTTVLLRRLYRINCGELSQTFRYPTDPQDRIWSTDTGFFPPSSTTMTYNGSINSTVSATPPLAVLQTSRVAPSGSLSYVLTLPDVKEDDSYFIVLSFAMLTNTTGQFFFDILLDGAVQQRNVALPGSFLATSYAFTAKAGRSPLNITLSSQSFAPEINAVEVYRVMKLAPPTTNTDANALNSVAVTYSLQFWDHDPCLPVAWNEIQCDARLLQVTSLDLSRKGLKGALLPYLGDLSELVTLNLSNNLLSGPIPPEIWELTELQSLDLSFNQLTGTLPTDFRSLDKLTRLNLQNNSLSGALDGVAKLRSIGLVNVMNNNFSGQVPPALAGKIIYSGNICLGINSSDCFQAVSPAPSPAGKVPLRTEPKGRSRNSSSSRGKVVGITVGCGALAVLVLGLLFFSLRKRLTRGTTLTTRIVTDARDWNNCREFSYRELKTATNGFKSQLGRGSFGPVYLGRLPNGQEVAIKVRSDQSQLGAEAFINEVSLLSRIKHQNLVELVGFCQKPKQILVYEYMAGGTLMDHLHGSKSPLDWKARLKVAAGAAIGLNYLHNGCDPKIIHRDVKSTNILLDSSLAAKVADFGLSKHFTNMEASHVTTMVKGTAGYLDPEYYASNQLTEKSDVYSFGVVLLEIICGREALCDSVRADEYSLITWARPHLQTGAYDEVVDRNIVGRYSVGSMTIVADVATKSVSRSPEDRPRMNDVARELREALALC